MSKTNKKELSTRDNLNQNSKLADIKFICEGRELNVHSALVRSYSEILAQEIDICKNTEGSNGIIYQNDFNLATLERMVEVMYTGSYSTPKIAAPQTTHDPNAAPAREVLLVHVQVHAIASHYEIPRIKGEAFSKFNHLLAADEDGTIPLDDLISLLEPLYSRVRSETAEMRAALEAAFRSRVDELLQHEAFIDGVEQGKTGYGQLSFALMASLSHELKSGA